MEKIEAAKAAGGSHGGGEYTPSGAIVGETEMLKSARLWVWRLSRAASALMISPHLPTSPHLSPAQVETQRRESELMVNDADSSRRDSFQSSVGGRSSYDSCETASLHTSLWL